MNPQDCHRNTQVYFKGDIFDIRKSEHLAQYTCTDLVSKGLMVFEILLPLAVMGARVIVAPAIAGCNA